MSYDRGLEAQLREDLEPHAPRAQKMFGGVCFMVRGHMVCGVHKTGALVRVGAPNMAAAQALSGVGPMTMTGRSMSGFVDVTPEAAGDDAIRARLLALALSFNASLPPK